MTKPLELGRRCRTCGNTEDWHRTNKVRHPFVDEDSDGPDGLGPRKDKANRAEKAQGTTKLQVRNQPVDLALRIALINKGILTPAEIAAADEQLREAIEGGHIIRTGDSAQRAGNAPGPSRDEGASSKDAVLGHGGGAPRGLRASDWPSLTVGDTGRLEDPKHRSGAEDELEDRYGLGDASAVPWDQQG